MVAEHGTAAVEVDGTFSYDFDETQEATNDVFYYQVVDEDGNTVIGRVTVVITDINDNDPTAEDITLTTDEDVVGSTAVSSTGTTLSNLSLVATDADSSAMVTYSLLSDATFGTAAVNADGTFSYEFDDELEETSDEFFYQIEDEDGKTAVGRVAVVITDINLSLIHI